jgi:RES domain-containing protein
LSIADPERGLSLVGQPMEVVRTLEARLADQARNDFANYLRRTLEANQAVGGRYNPPGEFGALYTASDEDTAWSELHSRFMREDIPGLPDTMGMLRIVITAGTYVDLTDAAVRDLWDVSEAALIAMNPTPAEQSVCWEVGRAVRAVADFVEAPSARASGHNAPLYLGRSQGELEMHLQSVDASRPTPLHLRQRAREQW